MTVEVGDHITWQRIVDEDITAVDGRRLTFRVKAEDSGGVAGEGTHERVLIDLARFLQRVSASR